MDAWVADFNKDVYEMWLSLKGDYAFWDKGFDVFFSPVKRKPRFMFVGFNPRGEAEAFHSMTQHYQSGNFTTHMVHEYEYNFAMHCKKFNSISGWKAYLGEDNFWAVIQDSIKANLVFFRSSNNKEWRDPEKMNRKVRKVLRTYCYAKDRQMIDRIQPEVILVEGLLPYDILKKHVCRDFKQQEVFYGKNQKNNKSRRIYARGSNGNTTIIAVPHPGSYTYYKSYIPVIKEFLVRDLQLLIGKPDRLPVS
ncbi:MAG: hypothetical protein JW920_07025 [Deltaproteobacteria bacterium]|nr:hypothetical protein [Deltaproteobacteria bacterium]